MSSSPPTSSSSPPPPVQSPPRSESPPPPAQPPPSDPPTSSPPTPANPPPEPENPSPPVTPPESPTDSPPPKSSPPPPPLPNTSPPPPSTTPGNSPPPSPPRGPPGRSPPPNPNPPPVPSGSPPVPTPPSSNSPPVPTPPSSNSPPVPTSPPIIPTPSPPPPSPLSPPSFSPPSPPRVPPGSNSTTINTNAGTTPSSSHSSSDGGISTGGTVAIALVVAFLILGALGIAACCVWKRKRRHPIQHAVYILPTTPDIFSEPGGLLKMQKSGSSLGSHFGYVVIPSAGASGGLGNPRSCFTYDELAEATNGFPAQNLLGEGGFGYVYKGTLVDGREIAVKQLNIDGGQGEREFRAEVEIISRIHHRHLVSLIGYCTDDNRRLLVYEYIPNNTLNHHLHGKGMKVLDWATRVKIASGAARGIAYLHEDCHPRIIHRDIKSSNILLDNDFVARVSDFGLAKLAVDAQTHITTRVMGTFGYMAPEYASSGKLTDKSDVYSFGVVLLELITGRKPVDISQPIGEESLVQWARPLLSHALETQEFRELADPRLDKQYDESEMFRTIEAAAACVRHSSLNRPTMRQVIRVFDNMATSDLSNGMRVGESVMYSSPQKSEEIRLFQKMAFGSQNFSSNFYAQS